jgi:hypothetical protein
MKKVVSHEGHADRTSIKMYKKFLFKGFDSSLFMRKDETLLQPNEFDPGKFKTVEDLVGNVDERRKLYNRYIRELDKKERRSLKEKELMEAIVHSTMSNHVMAHRNNDIIFARRNFPIDASIRKLDNSMFTFIRYVQEGIIEGFKTSGQTLGELNTVFRLPLQDARVKTLSSVAD